MYQVIACLIPGVVAMFWFFGIVALMQILLAVTTILITETLIMQLRHRPIINNIFDGSGILTGILLAISIPPIAPWWIVVIGSFFAITFGKQLYGGLGNNIFNPAMLGFVMLIISFPKEMTLWSTVNFHQQLSINAQLNLIFNAHILDGITGATPLATFNTAIHQGINAKQIIAAQNNNAFAVINIAFLIGGLVLLKLKSIDWRIPVVMLITLATLSLIFNLLNPNLYPPVYFYLLSGGTMLGAFFIATDPVTASTTTKGRIIYSALIGLILFIIRSFGTFHDAIAFAVLFTNMLVPLIDIYTKPKTFGKK